MGVDGARVTADKCVRWDDDTTAQSLTEHRTPTAIHRRPTDVRRVIETRLIHSDRLPLPIAEPQPILFR